MKKFTKTHEWILVEGNIGTVGITEQASKELGEIVYVELPRIKSRVKAGEEIVVLESTKAAIDILSPVRGTVVEVNEALTENCALLNHSPESLGWIFKLYIEESKDLRNLF